MKNMSSGDTTRSRNSASCSIERTSEKGQLTSAKVTYINERRTRPNLQISASLGGCSNDERLDFKSRQRKLLKGNFVFFNLLIRLLPLLNAACWCL